jgi:S-adenosylmethionine:tRNA ribosyltransferase-isomerase
VRWAQDDVVAGGAWTTLYATLRGAPIDVRPELAFPADEVPRHEVRLVAIERRPSHSVPGARLHRFADLPQLLRAGDLVVVNDAATLPASFRGVTAGGEVFELRLSSPPVDARLTGVLFGAGDWRTRTEHRSPPPRVAVGERVTLGGSLAATVAAVAGRRVTLDAAEHGDGLWQALYAIGVPVQYAHRSEPLPLWSVQTAYASRPWAVEMPSAGRALTWDVLLDLRRAGVAIATLTHAAGLGSTGDNALDRAMPWPERYEIPVRTAAAIRTARTAGGRVIAIGTTVVRALEASLGAPGCGTATLRLDRSRQLRVVDGLVSGLHVPGESHFEMLEAFAPRAHLKHGLVIAAANGLSAHELGDACLIL